MHVDFKKTCWERVNIPKDKEEEVKVKLESGEITSADDLMNIFDGRADDVDDTDEQMFPKENDGQPTIEMFLQKGDIDPKWDNSTEK